MTTWIMLRAAGVGAYMMLFASVAWGLIATTTLFGRKVARATATSVHQFVATVALVLLGVHLTGLLVDRFVPFSPLDILVPMHSSFQQLAVAHGVFAGTDTVRPWMWWTYVVGGALVVFLLVVRALTVGLRPARAAHPSNSAAVPRRRREAELAAEEAVPAAS